MKYIKPEIKISAFYTEDIITASGDANGVFEAVTGNTYSYVQAVNVSERCV